MTVMKRIIRIIFIIIVSSAFLISCEEKETNFKSMYEKWSPGTDGSYYLQFVDASQSFETGVDDQGSFIDINTTIAVALLGSPQSTDINVTINLNPASTVADSMYLLSASGITIPAGKTSGSFSLTAYAEKMPIDEWLDLIMVIDAGANNAPTGTTLHYKLKRILFCPLEDLNDLVGTWTGKDSWDYPTQVVTFVDGVTGDFMINGLNVGWMTDYWGEVVVDQVPLIMIMNPNGTLEIELQYYMETTWDGAPQPTYSISATGKWDNCKKTMIINYELWQGGDVLTTFTEDIALVTK